MPAATPATFPFEALVGGLAAHFPGGPLGRVAPGEGFAYWSVMVDSGQYLDMFDSESDLSGDLSDDELVEVP